MSSNIVRRVGPRFLSCCKCQIWMCASSRKTIQPIASMILQSNFGSRSYSSEPLPSPADKKGYPDHIVNIVDSISQLNLLEVSQLNELLKVKLNIQDAPMMPMGGMFAPPAEAEEDAAPVEIQTEFGVKILKFDDTKKVKLIKEIKSIMTDINLVQAKKFVESVPQFVKEKLSKEDADALKAQLEAVGAVVEID